MLMLKNQMLRSIAGKTSTLGKETFANTNFSNFE